ncbi:hypothetical protein HYFRA_00011620 [Hymenoscyphus fraxineus]|uniref:Alpha-ketoglutarate-dependent dioxygenase AlkB-like domain-containing protein n=1 Tax=Hymenoscyphus fraxineus TaxID=746836 RepID=A0A9N9KXM8_9HELO|nr:hypothetical protein HYFRA_00011620 [Hymenoscyphus fraxineus]
MDPNNPPVKKQKLNELEFIGQPATEESPVPDTTPRKRRSGTAQVDYSEPPTSPTSAPVEKSTDSSFEVSPEPVEQAAPRKPAPQKKGPAPSSKRQGGKRKAAEAPDPQTGALKKYFSKVDDAVAVDGTGSINNKFLQRKREQEFEAEEQDEEVDDAVDDKVAKDFVQSRSYLSKLEPDGDPEIFAHVRQALCDALPFFQAHQGGTYRNGGIAHGLLINTMVGNRDYFGHDVIITTCGGGRSKVGKEMKQTSHQKANDNFAACWKGSMKEKKAVVIIAGQCNPISPCKLPYAFNVLGWFHVTDVWMEERNHFKTWLVRLERVDLTKKPWYMPKNKQFLPSSYGSKTSQQTCGSCKQDSKVIFNIGWLCLSPGCPKHFQHPNYRDDKGLKYTEEFLQERTPFPGKNPGPLAPPLPTTESLEISGSWGTEKRYWKGIVCPKCHCCSRRLNWSEWACENKECDFTYHLEQPVVSAADAIADSRIGNPLNLRYHIDPQVKKSRALLVGNYTVYVYELPFPGVENGWGRVYHLKSNGRINCAPDGPNDMFAEMQKEEYGMKRNPVRNSGKEIEVVTRHWSANYGAPYKFGVLQGTSKSFSEAPRTLLKALKRVQWICEELFKKENNTQDDDSPATQLKEFNEVLNVGYFETCRMGFHDDGEKQLGPTVASLSFGSSATMSFRPKNKSAIPCPVKGNKDEKDEKDEKDKKDEKDEKDNKDDKDGEDEEADVPAGKDSKSSKTTHKADMLRIILDHGDIMVMDGPDVQVHYEHKVESHGRLRYAMTCRHIDIDTLEYDPKDIKGVSKNKVKAMTKDLRESAANAALMPVGHEEYNYDGNAELPAPEETREAIDLTLQMAKEGFGLLQSGKIDKHTLLATFNDYIERKARESSGH